MSNNVGNDAYASYDVLDNVPYLCISHLLDNDDLIWKLLYYKTPDAWDKPNLTLSTKRSLIYDGSDDSSKFRVFLDSGSPDAIVAEECIIRISPHSLFPETRTLGTINILFEVYSNFHINTLSNYKTRMDMISKRFIQIFNGINIMGVGRLNFDRMGSYADRMEYVGQIPIRGRWLIMSNRTS